MAEQAVVNAVARELNRRGAWHFNLHGSVMGIGGLPDRIATYRGHSLAIECKAPGGRLSKRQAHQLSRARAAGAIVIVARRLEDLTTVLDRIDAHLDHGQPLHQDDPQGTP